MKITNFDSVLASVPGNKTAAVVTGKGYGYEPAFKKARETWDAPLPVSRIESDYQNLDLRGVRYGRFLVLGLASGMRDAMGAKWVVRCQCGKYETRRARAIRNPKNCHDACAFCHHDQELRFAQMVQRHGHEKACQMRDAEREKLVEARRSEKLPEPVSLARRVDS